MLYTTCVSLGNLTVVCRQYEWLRLRYCCRALGSVHCGYITVGNRTAEQIGDVKSGPWNKCSEEVSDSPRRHATPRAKTRGGADGTWWRAGVVAYRIFLEAAVIGSRILDDIFLWRACSDT